MNFIPTDPNYDPAKGPPQDPENAREIFERSCEAALLEGKNLDKEAAKKWMHAVWSSMPEKEYEFFCSIEDNGDKKF